MIHYETDVELIDHTRLLQKLGATGIDNDYVALLKVTLVVARNM